MIRKWKGSTESKFVLNMTTLMKIVGITQGNT
jgi:hypothetical protein